MLRFNLLAKLHGKHIKIAFTEVDERVIDAALKLATFELDPVFYISKEDLIAQYPQYKNEKWKNFHFVDPKTISQKQMDEYVETIFQKRKGKNTKEEIQGWLKGNNYLSVIHTNQGGADVLVIAKVKYTTADTIRPIFQIIGAKTGFATSCFVMIKGSKVIIFGDCAVNPVPTSEQLAETAVLAANFAKNLGIEPKVAMLSFSTNGSAAHEEVTKVQKAVQILRDQKVNFDFEGEMQFDAAVMPSIAKKKFPNSKIAGDANIFIFPNLNAGNIGYKIAERLGGFDAFGAIMLGLNCDISDLSRGASADDIFTVSLLTAAMNKKIETNNE